MMCRTPYPVRVTSSTQPRKAADGAADGARDALRSQPPATPNFRRFLITGALVGFVVGGWISISRVFENPGRLPPGYQYSESTAAGFLAVVGAIIGCFIAAGLALLLEWRSRR